MDRVLELGGFAAGYCGRLFVQAGSDVVRVETGARPPAWVSDAAMDLYLHAGKRRIATDDPELIADLAARADVVVVEGDTADAVEALGFDAWDAPVKAAITPFGRTGPKRNWQASTNVLLAMGGYTYIIGDPERAPLTLPGHYPEFQSGAFAYAAANACRLAGERNVIDLGMLEVVMALSQFTTVMWHCGGLIRERHGSDFYYVVPTNLFRCADGWAYVNIVPGFWDPFAAFLDRPDLVIDERFETNALRRDNRHALHAIIAAAIGPMTRAEVRRRAEECRIPIGVVQTIEDVLADPHLAVRGFWQTVRNGKAGSVRAPRRAWRMDGRTPPSRDLLPMETDLGERHDG
ncbi:MAG: CoA transferase [Gammaproteobacteria bacterium]|nr:CoA transferase [Gammaproteobacteria bacterium]